MRIITNGEEYAVARRRWIFTQVLSCFGNWFTIHYGLDLSNCWMSLEQAQELMKKEKLKKTWWTYQGKG